MQRFSDGAFLLGFQTREIEQVTVEGLVVTHPGLFDALMAKMDDQKKKKLEAAKGRARKEREFRMKWQGQQVSRSGCIMLCIILWGWMRCVSVLSAT